MRYGIKAGKPKNQTVIDRALDGSLLPGEVGEFATGINRVRGMLSWLVVTNYRVLALGGAPVKVVHSIEGPLLTGYSLNNDPSPKLQLATIDGDVHQWGHVLSKEDVADLRVLLDRLPGAPDLPEEARRALNAQTIPTGADLAGVDVVGKVVPKAIQVIHDHSGPAERPWFVLGNGGAGAMACFDDRLMVIKVGAVASFMAGSLGGGRITTIYYRDITGIEYNSGIASGVLEIATPSYQASANKDYWRGSNQGRNANANDPWVLSNTLPLGRALYSQATQQLNELRALISRSKAVTVQVTMASPLDVPVASAPSAPTAPTAVSALAGQLAELAALHSQGVLSDEEFAQAKVSLIANLGRP